MSSSTIFTFLLLSPFRSFRFSSFSWLIYCLHDLFATNLSHSSFSTASQPIAAVHVYDLHVAWCLVVVTFPTSPFRFTSNGYILLTYCLRHPSFIILSLRIIFLISSCTFQRALRRHISTFLSVSRVIFNAFRVLCASILFRLLYEVAAMVFYF